LLTTTFPRCRRTCAQKEYRNRTITRIFGGNAYLGCYFLTVCIFGAGLLRDHLYVAHVFFSVHLLSPSSPSTSPSIFFLGLSDSLTPHASYLSAILEQPRARLLPTPLDTLIPAALFVIGQTFVVTSTWSLGITGTFLGDYFGILMDARVEGFPFNVLRDPMYVGSTMCFAATALWCVPSYHAL
jgi:phosphatidylethanolamine/phosphatidyl-N-methylethanolamine N-methyltransferase